MPHAEKRLAGSERLGVIGSPSSTAQLALDILGVAAGRKLVGELALFSYPQDGEPHYALGQVTEVELRNVWHEDPTMRSLIRQRGRIDAVSERQDTHLGKMVASAVFRRGGPRGYEPSILGTVPSTGTPVHVVTDEILDEILQPYRSQLFYLGHVYGSAPKLPLWFKHFASGPDGAGEAYHLGIFGKTGSGKSVLAKMILLAYARYRQMGLLVIDPQGEFARDIGQGATTGEFALPLKPVMEGMGRRLFTLTVRNLVLDTWSLFEQILFESLFFEKLSVSKGENRALACRTLADNLRKKHVKLDDLHKRESFDTAWGLLGQESVQKLFYLSKDSRARFDSVYQESNPNEFYSAYWLPVTQLFRTDRRDARRVEEAVKWVLTSNSAPVLVVDLSKERAQAEARTHGLDLLWNDRIQSLVIKRLLDGLTGEAERAYADTRTLNALVVIDEAHRLAPRGRMEDDEFARDVRNTLIDAARTTRKYGLGWLFISQTLSSIHQEIIQQLRIFFFGFGLSLGQEFQSLRELVGSSGTALSLYQLFRDPHSAFDVSARTYSWMTIGPVSPLSFAGTPLFFNAFNTVEAFVEANGLSTGTP